MGKALLQAGHRGAQPGDESLEQAVTVRLAGQDRRDSCFERVPRPRYGQARVLGHQGAEHRVAAERGDPGGVINVIPQINSFMDDGSTKEEWKMVAETKKILDPKIKLIATCVRVPVFIGHSEAVNIEFDEPVSADEAREILRKAPGCLVIDRREPGGYITPHEAAGEDATFISRIRDDPTIDNGLNLWIVSDNLRKGAALNAVQIAEVLVNRGWLKPKLNAA